ncbi:VENN motif pre-toxin domain-containing protein [Aeromonas intestinalis]
MARATGELVGMLATELYHKDASQLTEGEKETVSTLATLSAGLTGADGTDVLAGAQTGKTVVENNFLSSKSSERRDVLADKVLSGDRSLTTAREFLALENADRRSEALLAKYVIDQKSMTATEIAELTSYLKIYASEMQATKTDEQIQTLVDGMLRGDNGLKSAPNREAQNIAKSTMTEWRYHISNASIGDPVILYGLGPLGNSIKTGMLTNAAIGAGVNTAVQLAGNKNFDYIDVMVAGVTSAATTGKGMLPSIGINAGGAALGSLIKGEDPTNSVIGAGAGTVVGGLGGPLIKVGLSKVTKESTAELSGSVLGSYIGEKTSKYTEEMLKGTDNHNEEN